MPTHVIAGPLWARDQAEGAVLLGALHALCAHGLPVVLADGGSPHGFLRHVEGLPRIALLHRGTGPGSLVRQVRAALGGAVAQGAERILYIEPDKRWFFEHRLAAMLAADAHEPRPGVLVGSRDPVSFDTYPYGQRLVETMVNRLCAEVLGPEGDFMYGPLGIDPQLVPYLDDVPDDLAWGWRPFLMAVACRLGLGVRLHVADLPCPLDQRDEDDPAGRHHRLRQTAQNFAGIELGLRVPLPAPLAEPCAAVSAWASALRAQPHDRPAAV